MRDVYKSLAPLMLYAVALVVVVLYALADQLHDFVCRILIPQYYYPYTTPLALIQVLSRFNSSQKHTTAVKYVCNVHTFCNSTIPTSNKRNLV